MGYTCMYCGRFVQLGLYHQCMTTAPTMQVAWPTPICNCAQEIKQLREAIERLSQQDTRSTTKAKSKALKNAKGKAVDKLKRKGSVNE